MEDDSSTSVSEEVETEDLDTARECRVARRELCAAQPWNLGAVLQAAFDLINASLQRWGEHGWDDEGYELLKELVQLLEATAAQPGDDVPDDLELLASLFLLGVSGGFFKHWCMPAHDSLSLLCAPEDEAAAAQLSGHPAAVQLALLRLLAPPLVEALVLLEEVEAYRLFADAAEHVAELCEGDDVPPPALSIRVPPEVRVLALDLDDTVYMHDHIPEMFQVYEAVRGFMDPLVLRDMLAAGVPHRGFLLALIDSMHATGRNVFVVSFGRDDWVLPAAEAALGGRVPSTAIYTRSDEPHGEEPPDKSGWLADIARRCGVPRGAVQLVDDSTINVHAAALDGFQALKVSPSQGLHYTLWHEALMQYAALQLGPQQEPLGALQLGADSGAAGLLAGCGAAHVPCAAPAPRTAMLRSGSGMGLAGCGMIRVPAPPSSHVGPPAAAAAAVAAPAAAPGGAAAGGAQPRRESPRDAQDNTLPRSPSRVGGASGSPHSITGSPLSRTGSGGSPLGELGGTPRVLMPSFAEAGEAAVLLTAMAKAAAAPVGGSGATAAAGGGSDMGVDAELAAAVEALVLSVVREALGVQQQPLEQQAGAAAAGARAAGAGEAAVAAAEQGSSAGEAGAGAGQQATDSAAGAAAAAAPMAGDAAAAAGPFAAAAAAAALGSHEGSAPKAGDAGAGEVGMAGGAAAAAAAAAGAAGEQDDSPAWGVVEEAAVLAALRSSSLSAPPSECSVGSSSAAAAGVRGGGSLGSVELGLPRRGSSGGSSSCEWGEDDSSVSLLVAEVGCGGGSERGSERSSGGADGANAASAGKQAGHGTSCTSDTRGSDGVATAAAAASAPTADAAAGTAAPAGSGSPKRSGGFAGFVARHSPRRHRREAGAPRTDGAAAPPTAGKPAAAAAAVSASARSPPASKADAGMGAEQQKGKRKKKGLAAWLARRGAEQSP